MKTKILIVLGIICAIFTSAIIPVNAQSKFEDEDYLEQNYARVELGTKIQKTFEEHYDIKNVYTDSYPSYYGGMYISDDAQNLIIQIVEKNIPDKNSDEYYIYNELITMDDSIKIEYVENTFNDLNKVNNYISSNLIQKTDKNITSTYVDIMNNTVGVTLINNDVENREKIEKIVLNLNDLEKNGELIKFYDSKEYTTSANINAGGKIWLNSAKTSYCSMGMRVKYNGNNGYLTAGHCAINYTSFPSGTIQVKQFYNNQKYDYAFVKTNSSYTPTNNLAYTTTNITYLGLINYCPTIITNMVISKAGVRTGYTSGKVTGLNQSVYYSNEGKTITGLIKSNVYQGQGDSGGVVMIPRTNSNGGAIGLGILSGGVNLDNEMYFSDLNVLPIALQNRY